LGVYVFVTCVSVCFAGEIEVIAFVVGCEEFKCAFCVVIIAFKYKFNVCIWDYIFNCAIVAVFAKEIRTETCSTGMVVYVIVIVFVLGVVYFECNSRGSWAKEDVALDVITRFNEATFVFCG
jgi:hypothetical protein